MRDQRISNRCVADELAITLRNRQWLPGDKEGLHEKGAETFYTISTCPSSQLL